ncbi:MAG: tetratricopeptide repeat protein [Lutibacter sp.]|nr:tetratricopeptide repeat protein [Lutibacter sp.]
MRQMRQILAVLFFIVSAPVVFSQADNEECIVKYNLFKGDYSAGKYDVAYENWLWTMDHCPTLTVNIYKLGIKIAESRLEAATTPADKAAAVKLVERVYTQRLEHFPQDLARVYSDFATFKDAQGASEDEVFVLLEKSFKADVTDISPANIYRYFDIILNKYKDTNAQKVFDTYDEVGEGLELKREEYSKQLDIITAKDSTTLSDRDKNNKIAYEQHLSNLDLVETSLDAKLAAISTCANLIPLNKKYFQENKTDAVWLKRAVSRMYNKECTDDAFYDVLVEAYVKADPSPQASVFYADILMKNGETNKAMEYFKKAIEQETDSYNKAKYAFKVAQILRKKGRLEEARTYAYKALDFQPRMGNAYLLIATMYAASANSCGNDVVSKRMVYVAALNKAIKAKSVDPSISTLANRFISNYAEHVPTKKDLFVAGVQSGSSHRIGCWINETVIVP